MLQLVSVDGDSEYLYDNRTRVGTGQGIGNWKLALICIQWRLALIFFNNTATLTLIVNRL